MISSGFFNSIGGDRRYTNQQFSTLVSTLINDGVIGSVGGTFFTQPVQGMEVGVKDGFAWFNDAWIKNDSLLVLTVPDADVSLARYDAIAIEVNTTEEVRDGTIKYITGVASATPTKPVMEDSENVHQHAIAYIKVNPGVTAIEEKDIEIVVGLSGCPFSTGILETADITEMFDKWTGDFEEWFNHIKGQLEGDVATNLQLQIDQLQVAMGEKAGKEDTRKASETVLDITRNKLAKIVGAPGFHPTKTNNTLLDIDIDNFIKKNDYYISYYDTKNYRYTIYGGSVTLIPNTCTIDDVKKFKIKITKFNLITRNTESNIIIDYPDNFYETLFTKIKAISSYGSQSNSYYLRIYDGYISDIGNNDEVITFPTFLARGSTGGNENNFKATIMLNLNTFKIILYGYETRSGMLIEFFYRDGIFSIISVDSSNSAYSTLSTYTGTIDTDGRLLNWTPSSSNPFSTFSIKQIPVRGLISIHDNIVLAPVDKGYSNASESVDIVKIDPSTKDQKVITFTSPSNYLVVCASLVKDRVLWLIVQERDVGNTNIWHAKYVSVNLDTFSIIKEIPIGGNRNGVSPMEYIFSIDKKHYYTFGNSLLVFDEETDNFMFLPNSSIVGISSSLTGKKGNEYRYFMYRNYEKMGKLIPIPKRSKYLNIDTDELLDISYSLLYNNLTSSGTISEINYRIYTDIVGYYWILYDETASHILKNSESSFDMHSETFPILAITED